MFRYYFWFKSFAMLCFWVFASMTNNPADASLALKLCIGSLVAACVFHPLYLWLDYSQRKSREEREAKLARWEANRAAAFWQVAGR